MAYQQHIDSSRQLPVRCAVITLSDTRTFENDTSGQSIIAFLSAKNHPIASRQILKDDPAVLGTAVRELLVRSDIDAILTTGGTGISRRDQTIDVLEKLIEQPLPGFGELFRMLSYSEIGSGAMLSRATAGIAHGKLIFAMPGSTGAVELAMTKLILPELSHLLHQLRKA